MIALAHSGASDMVELYRSERGFLGGNVEPIDCHSSGAPGGSPDKSLAALGYIRAEAWRVVEAFGIRNVIAKVTPI